ncbi:GtrA family protein [Streptomyces sp. NPDC021749]|uniref:GtrA family protein n=1 Tax=Streptomyces sp. NPDC021749 TaxID=3154905 RepID=UPI0033EFD352
MAGRYAGGRRAGGAGRYTGGRRAGGAGQLVRFAAVGVVNTATFYACYLPLHRLLPYFAAYSLAFALSMAGSFLLHTRFTYRTRPTWKKFLLFPLTQVTNYAMQSAGLLVLVGWCGMSSALAPLAAAALALPAGHLVARRILRPPARAGGGAGAVPGAAGQAGASPVRSGDPV